METNIQPPRWYFPLELRISQFNTMLLLPVFKIKKGEKLSDYKENEKILILLRQKEILNVHSFNVIAGNRLVHSFPKMARSI